jgi:hypothetical protein
MVVGQPILKTERGYRTPSPSVSLIRFPVSDNHAAFQETHPLSDNRGKLSSSCCPSNGSQPEQPFRTGMTIPFDKNENRFSILILIFIIIIIKILTIAVIAHA